VLETVVERELSREEVVAPSGAVRAAIVGATGYAGRELVNLLARHPHARLARLMSSGRGGQGARPIEQFHPALRGRGLFCDPLRQEELDGAELDVVFLATPHEVSHDLAPALLERGVRVVDISGAFRLEDAGAYPRWYGFEHHAGAALRQAVYGLPELNAPAVQRARLVSNPGCYATSIILALAPLAVGGWLDLAAGVVSDSKSGASGAGRTPSDGLHFVEVNENCRAYGLFSHRHVPEILQALGLEENGFTFTPHLLPITRGILSTSYVRLAEHRTLEEVSALYRNFYARAPLVRVYDEGRLPEIQAVAHTNYADLGFALDVPTRRLVIVSALDNLGKGAAGQAVQNMNLMYGFAEETGLV
jgi:N-acetyl-gamma-glutamyl-phosphate reductase